MDKVALVAEFAEAGITGTAVDIPEQIAHRQQARI
jgi:hypothetical protein